MHLNRAWKTHPLEAVGGLHFRQRRLEIGRALGHALLEHGVGIAQLRLAGSQSGLGALAFLVPSAFPS